MTKHLPLEQQIPYDKIKHFLFFSIYLFTDQRSLGEWFISQCCTAVWLPLWKSARDAETCREILFPPSFSSGKEKGLETWSKGNVASSCLWRLLAAICSAVKTETSRFPFRGQAACTATWGHNLPGLARLLCRCWPPGKVGWVLGCCCPW